MAEDVVEEDDASAAHDLDNSRPLCFEGHCRGCSFLRQSTQETGHKFENWSRNGWPFSSMVFWCGRPLLTYLKGMGHNGTESFL